MRWNDKSVFSAKNYMYVYRHKGVWGADLPSNEQA